MIKEIRMPAGGQTTDVSVVGAWLVKTGDRVERGDALLEIETDKATLTVESYAEGMVLALLAEEGDEARTGEVIALIGDESDQKEAAKRISGKGKPAGQEPEEEKAQMKTAQFEEEYQPIAKNTPERTEQKEIKAMPNAKLLAGQNNILLSSVAKAAGKDILKRQDVKAFLENCEPEGRDTIIPFTQMRKAIIRRMTESMQNIPAFTASVEIDMTQCIALRKLVNSADENKKISYHDILFKCMEAAIRSYPYVNASYSEEGAVLHQDVNIGLAVSVEGGLVVPVVKKVQDKSISGISACNRENIEKAREKRLVPEEMAGGTITLSNLGMYPVTEFTAIINSPEACILAVGAMEEKLILSDGACRSIPVMKVTGSFDHRLIDGAYAAGFLSKLKKLVENPALALV